MEVANRIHLVSGANPDALFMYYDYSHQRLLSTHDPREGWRETLVEEEILPYCTYSNVDSVRINDELFILALDDEKKSHLLAVAGDVCKRIEMFDAPLYLAASGNSCFLWSKAPLQVPNRICSTPKAHDSSRTNILFYSPYYQIFSKTPIRRHLLSQTLPRATSISIPTVWGRANNA